MHPNGGSERTAFRQNLAVCRDNDHLGFQGDKFGAGIVAANLLRLEDVEIKLSAPRP